MECPELHRDQMYLEEKPTEAECITTDHFQGRIRQLVTQYMLRIPFTGHPAPFVMKAREYFTPPIEGTVDEAASELVIIWEGTRPEPDAVRQWLHGRVDLVERGLASARADINAHNGNLLNQAPQWVAQRRGRLLAARQVHASEAFR